jgi:Spy/CpxP family protein refolding chaperone
MRARFNVFTLFLVLACFTAAAVAQGPEQGQQQGPPPGGGPQGGGEIRMRTGGPRGGGEMHMRHMEGHDPLGEFMFPPEMILEHTAELNLTAEQKTAIRGEVKNTQSKFTDLQFQLQDEMQALHGQLSQPKTDEAKAMAQLDKALDVERQIKRLHVGMMIRIKNQLTAEQVDKLHKMMGPMHEKHPMPGGGGAGGGEQQDEE